MNLRLAIGEAPQNDEIAKLMHITSQRNSPMTDPNSAAIYGAPWIPSIYPSHVSIYTSTMDPMGLGINRNNSPN